MPNSSVPQDLPLLLGGEPASTGRWAEVRAPWDGMLVGRAAVAGPAEVTRAIDDAHRAAPEARSLPAWRRAEILMRIHDGARELREELAFLLAREAGKPLAAARYEVDRVLFVFRDAAAEAQRIGGEVIPLDRMPHGAGRWGLTRRFPLAPVSGIVPFNFPLLLAAHKIAPAIACGATLVLKTPPQDPLALLRLARVVAGAGYPAGGVGAVHCSVEDAAPLIDDPRVRMVSFTGSARAGWAIRRQAATKRVLLELGGNAGVIVAADADLDRAADRCVAGGFTYAGQSCISVQRILVHRDAWQPFLERLLPRVEALHTGDPLAAGTDVGPMIDEAAARRAESWIADALAAGATAHTGVGRSGAVLEPTVLTGTTPGMQVECEEVFAPVVTVRPWDTLEEAFAALNASDYGLQAGIFTRDLRTAWAAFEALEVGGVIVDDIPGYRVDHMPYGGVKASGQGREGVRYAIEEMTDLRLLVI
ncbi:MAG TPA: aldehyde dehydrogenase family protein [Gemmatimonadales bacterium]|nr:aldehyde dehydrogenase family protein [Gemmatimonadales bacterium]